MQAGVTVAALKCLPSTRGGCWLLRKLLIHLLSTFYICSWICFLLYSCKCLPEWAADKALIIKLTNNKNLMLACNSRIATDNCYLRLWEVHVHAPLDKLLIGHLQTPLISLLAVDPDELLSKLLWKKFRHLSRKTSSTEFILRQRQRPKRLMFNKKMYVKIYLVFISDLFLVDLDGLV